MRKGKVFIVSGPSGSGKGTIVKGVVAQKGNIYLSTSWTTRMPRNTEAHGVEYFFVSFEEFEEMKKKDGFLEWATYKTGDSYGTIAEPVYDALDKGMDVILEIDVQGALMVKEKIPDAILIMLTPPDIVTLERRLRSRKDNTPEETIQKRLSAASKEMLSLSEYDYHILNEDNMQEACMELLHSIMCYEHTKNENGEENSKYKEAAEANRAKDKLYLVEKF